MTITRAFTLVVLIGLTSCNPAGNKSKQSASNDTASLVLTNTVHADHLQFILDTTVVFGFRGDTAEQIGKTLKLVADIDKASTGFRLDTFSIDEKTSEGGEVIVFHDRLTSFIKCYGTLFGEMGKTEFSFYFLNSRHPNLSCAVYNVISYNKPMYEKDMKIKETKTTYEVYCDNKIIAVLDDHMRKQSLSMQELKTKETDTRQFFTDYIGQIKLVK